MDTINIPNDILLPEVGALLSEGREVILMTKGYSMLPFIRGGRDSVHLTAPASVCKGDVVLARIPSSGTYVLHRVAAISAQGLTLKGDGNLRGMEQCSPQDVMGVATAVSGPSGRRRAVRSAKVWNALPVFPRRCVLALCRHQQNISNMDTYRKILCLIFSAAALALCAIGLKATGAWFALVLWAAQIATFILMRRSCVMAFAVSWIPSVLLLAWRVTASPLWAWAAAGVLLTILVLNKALPAPDIRVRTDRWAGALVLSEMLVFMGLIAFV